MLPRDHAEYKNGTEKDGSENELYCALCYVDGEFTSQDTIKTAADMQAFCKKVLKGQGVGPLRRWFYTMGIPQLERWKK